MVQAFEGLVYMDFDPVAFEAKGHGTYERLTASQLHAALPLLWLAYSGEPSDSGAIHSDVKQRWRNGDSDAVQGMSSIAAVAAKAREAIRLGDSSECRRLMAENFRLRRKLFGDAVLGATNLRLINIAEQNGAVAKFPGSAAPSWAPAMQRSWRRCGARTSGKDLCSSSWSRTSRTMVAACWRRGWARWRWSSPSVVGGRVGPWLYFFYFALSGAQKLEGDKRPRTVPVESTRPKPQFRPFGPDHMIHITWPGPGGVVNTPRTVAAGQKIILTSTASSSSNSAGICHQDQPASHQPWPWP